MTQVYIGAAVVGVLGARKMIPLYMLSHILMNVAVTAVIILFAIMQAIFGYDTQDDIVVMFAIRIPLLAAVACGIPSYQLYTATAAFRRDGVGRDPGNSMLEAAVGSDAPMGADGSVPTQARQMVQQAGAAALARARSDAGIARMPSDELPGVKPEYL